MPHLTVQTDATKLFIGKQTLKAKEIENFGMKLKSNDT